MKLDSNTHRSSANTRFKRSCCYRRITAAHFEPNPRILSAHFKQAYKSKMSRLTNVIRRELATRVDTRHTVFIRVSRRRFRDISASARRISSIQFVPLIYTVKALNIAGVSLVCPGRRRRVSIERKLRWWYLSRLRGDICTLLCYEKILSLSIPTKTAR